MQGGRTCLRKGVSKLDKEKLYVAFLAACISYGVPKIIDLLSQATLWVLTHWL